RSLPRCRRSMRLLPVAARGRRVRTSPFFGSRAKTRIVGMELRHEALRALCEPGPRAKAAQARSLFEQARQLPLSPTAPVPPATLPGRPERPRLVHPARVPRRSPAKPEGLAALLHAIAHIEFNAINLALDAVWRFEGMPPEFHHDWLRVAAE